MPGDDERRNPCPLPSKFYDEDGDLIFERADIHGDDD